MNINTTPTTYPIRVLQVVTKMDRAGLETMLMNYYRHIDRGKIQFDFLTHRSEKGDYDDEILSMGGRIFNTYPVNPRCFTKYLADLKKFFGEHEEYRIVHSHIDSLSVFPLRAAKKAGVPVRIAHSHSNDFDRNVKLLFRYVCKSVLLSKASHFWGCSNAAVRFMFGKGVFNGGEYTVLKNAIDSERFTFHQDTRTAARKELGLENKFVIGHVGRITYPKNHEFLIDIFAKIRAKNKDAVILLVGDGENKQKLREQVKKLGLVESVRFLGVRPDIPELMQAMDVFMLPSRYEGLGIVLIEAQAAGLPSLASDAVPDEAAVTDLVRFIPLSESAAFWADAALALKGKERINTFEKLQQSGYDIVKAAEDLEKMYLSMAAVISK